VNTALAFIGQNTARLHVDSSKLFLAGDSAGSQIAAQLANIVSVLSYANEVGITPSIKRSQLRGVILHCGVYGIEKINFEEPFGAFRRTVLWSYFGTKDFLQDPRLAQFSVARHITGEFPPMFISAGNGDPRLPQSHMLAATAARLGVIMDNLFFFRKLHSEASP
jgi:acetyl esterase/lipase